MQPLHNPNTLPEDAVNYFRHKGIKIKLSDIENAISDYPYINGVAVLCNEDNEGDRQLVAYVIPSGTFRQTDVTNFLKEKLKPFMIPAVWVCVNEFPLTDWGSINKTALYELQSNEVEQREFIAPRNKIESKLAAIIQALLNVENISINDNFLKLGGNSLLALKVIAALRKQFQVSIDIKSFFLYPTIADMAGYLSSFKINNTVPYATTGKQNTPSLNSTCIVPVKAGSSKMPLYIVCGGGGTVFTFEKFAHLLDKGQPVYGFQQPSGINELVQFPDTIEDIAAKYVNELLLINPNGPYALSGHCIGGVIALEMARKLQSMGKKIHMLALFDVILTEDQQEQKAIINKYSDFYLLIKKAATAIWRKIEFEMFLLTRYTKDALAYKWEKIKSFLTAFYRHQKEDTDAVVFTKFEQKFEEAYSNYKVKNFSGSMLVFYAKEHYHFVDKDRNIHFKKFELSTEVKSQWMNYADNVAVFEVDGGHSSIFEPVYATKFASLLQQHLQA